MIGRVIEIASEGRHLARYRGLMTVSAGNAEDGRVPLDDIGVLLCNARGLTYSNDLLTELARRGAAVVLCGGRLHAGGVDLAAGWEPHSSIADAFPTGGVTAFAQASLADNGQN